MDTFIQHFTQVISSFGLIFVTLFTHHTLTSLTNTTVSVQPTQTASAYHISRTFIYQGHSILLSAAIPKEGGDITGSISGTCNGTITGKYDGKDPGAITGQSHGTCHVSFVQIPGTVSFTGTVSKKDENAKLKVTIAVASINKTENVTLKFK